MHATNLLEHHTPQADDTQATDAARLRVITQLPLSEGLPATRWLALDETTHSNHLLYEFAPQSDCHADALLSELRDRAAVRCAHLLHVEAAWRCERTARVWASTPYPGNQHGLVTIDDLIAAKGGRFRCAPEARRAIEQILTALRSLHAAGFAAGDLTSSRVLVDPRGTVKLEFHGLGTRQSPPNAVPQSAAPDLIHDDVAAAAALAYRILSGRPATEPRTPLAAILPAGGPLGGIAWDAWLDRALDPVEGYTDAEAALSALPDATDAPPTPVVSATATARLVLGGLGGRLRRAAQRVARNPFPGSETATGAQQSGSRRLFRAAAERETGGS